MQPKESVNAKHRVDGEHPDDGLLANVSCDGGDAAARNGAVPGPVQQVLPRQAQRAQAAVAANVRSLCAEGRVHSGP